MMKEYYGTEIERKLKNVPMGSLLVRKHHMCQRESMLQSEYFHGFSDGKGVTEIFSIFPGIEVSLNRFYAKRLRFHHIPLKSIMQLNHCRQGRLGWEMKAGLNIYLGAGDLSIHMLDSCAESEMNLPLGFYEGIAVSADMEKLAEVPPEILETAGINSRRLAEKFCKDGRIAAVPANHKISCIFDGMYNLPKEMCIPYFKLKVQELMLFLWMMETSKEQELNSYFSEQVEIIKEIHEQLTSNLDRRFTIEELAKQHLINTSSLKAVFKAVYGLPIASYMKEYRIRQAADRLRNSNDSIAEIAAFVGYESQSKFTKAFKEVMQILPTAYRKQYSGQNSS